MSFCNVYFNDTHWGFYTVVDPVEKSAISRFFGENSGNLYKGDPRGTLEWHGTGEASYRSNYEKATNEDIDDWSDLISFIKFINNSSIEDFQANLLNRLDAFSFARFWAANTFLANLDSYQGSGHNYYLYFDSSQKARLIVWDINEAFGVFTAGYSGSITNMPLYWVGGTRPLLTRQLNNYPDFRTLVNCAVNELISGYFNEATFTTRVNALSDLIRPHVYADIGKMFSNANFETNLTTDIRTGGNYPGLTSFVRNRTTFLNTVLTPCGTSDISGTILINELMASNGSTIADEAGDFDDWFELYNPSDTAVNISGWYATDNISNSRKWMFPEGTIIASGEYILVWADDEPEEGSLHTTFKLNVDEEHLAIFGSDILGNTLCDFVEWVSLSRDTSYGRFPNGSDTWQICLVPTPGRANVWESVEENILVPDGFTINVFPNPFNPSVNIHIEGLDDYRELAIFDTEGRKIDVLHLSEGAQFINWKPQDRLMTGVYLLKVTTSKATYQKKLIYLK